MTDINDTFLEIYVSPQAGFAGIASETASKAKDAFDALGSLLTEAIEPLRQKLALAAVSADEVEVKLDFAFKGAGKWVVVSAEVGATVSIRLIWKNK